MELITVELRGGGEDGKCAPLIHGATMAQPAGHGNNPREQPVAGVTPARGDRLSA